MYTIMTWTIETRRKGGELPGETPHREGCFSTYEEARSECAKINERDAMAYPFLYCVPVPATE